MKILHPQGSIKHDYLQPKCGLDIMFSFQNTSKQEQSPGKGEQKKSMEENSEKYCLSQKIKGHI